MATKFCLPVVIADEMKKAARLGKFKIADLYDMESKARQDEFATVVDRETAKAINTAFEEAISKKTIPAQQRALKAWAEHTFKGKENKPKFNDVITKINNLEKEGLLTPESEKAFLSDFIEKKLGASITTEEAKFIVEKSKKMEQSFSKIKDNFGIPGVDDKGHMEYLLHRREMDNYLDSLTPSSNLRVITSTIARGNMLLRIASTLVNINSNNIEGAIGAIVRRFSERTIKGDNTQEIGKYIKFNAEIFRKTGYDLSRMVSIESGKKILGEESANSQGKGLVHAAGRWYEDKVFNLSQGLPDNAAASAAFADRSDLMATRLVRHAGLKGENAKKRGLEIIQDSMRIEPQTKEGALVRQISRIDAERSTNTDKRILAEKLLKFRQILNIGDLRFGDMNIPFVKTTANAIQSSLETSGITVAPKAIANMIKMVKLVREGESWGEASKESFSGFGETMVRAGLGTIAAFLIANAVKKEDYVGIYPLSGKERELFGLKNSPANSIRINGKYYSLDWFGPMAAPLIGFLNAKKYGTDIPNSLFFYGQGAGYQILKAPGVDYIYKSIDSLKGYLTSQKGTTPKEIGLDLANYSVDFIKSRFIPGFAQTIAELQDNVVRDTSSKGDILAPLKSVVPVLRQTLPEKRNVFGETTATEGINALIFGGRLKTANESPLLSELDRLSESGNLPSISDVSRTSSRAKDLRVQIGEERFSQAMQVYGSKMKSEMEKIIRSPEYRKSDDEKKQNILDKVKTDQFNIMLKRAGYRKPKK